MSNENEKSVGEYFREIRRAAEYADDPPALKDFGIHIKRKPDESDRELTQRMMSAAEALDVNKWSKDSDGNGWRPTVEPAPPKDVIRASIQGGTILIEREEMERVKALGVDIREQHTAFRFHELDLPPRELGSFNCAGEWREPDEASCRLSTCLGTRRLGSDLCPACIERNDNGKGGETGTHTERLECPDCTADPGWYNGICDRKPCPTCQGGE